MISVGSIWISLSDGREATVTKIEDGNVHLKDDNFGDVWLTTAGFKLHYREKTQGPSWVPPTVYQDGNGVLWIVKGDPNSAGYLAINLRNSAKKRTITKDQVEFFKLLGLMPTYGDLWKAKDSSYKVRVINFRDTASVECVVCGENRMRAFSFDGSFFEELEFESGVRNTFWVSKEGNELRKIGHRGGRGILKLLSECDFLGYAEHSFPKNQKPAAVIVDHTNDGRTILVPEESLKVAEDYVKKLRESEMHTPVGPSIAELINSGHLAPHSTPINLTRSPVFGRRLTASTTIRKYVEDLLTAVDKRKSITVTSDDSKVLCKFEGRRGLRVLVNEILRQLGDEE
jgi:hypothetical protein